VRFLVEQKEDLQMLTKMKDYAMLAVVPVSNLDSPAKNSVKLMSTWQSKKLRSQLSVKDLFGYGCLARIASLTEDSRGYLVVTLEGISRFRVVNFNDPMPNFPLSCEIESLPEEKVNESNLTAKAAIDTFRLGGRELVDALKTLQLPPAVLRQLTKMLESTSPGQLADQETITSIFYFPKIISISGKQTWKEAKGNNSERTDGSDKERIGRDGGRR
jgi:ATP-dependent Lon protease